MTDPSSSAVLTAPPTTAERNDDLRRRRAEVRLPMGQAAVDKVHDKGRLTARERLDVLLDEGSFVEIDELARHRTHAFGMGKRRPVTDGIICGWGTIDGREVCVFSQDGTVFGGALGEVYGEKMTKLQQLACETGRPLIGLYEGAGARIQDGVVSLDFIAQTFYHNVRASGVVPQISVIMGACAGGNAYSPALTDFVVMVRDSAKMFVTGPDVITTVTGEKITQAELGGAEVHMTTTGNSHYTAADDTDALEWVQELVSYLPGNNRELAPVEPAEVEEGQIADSLTETDLTLDSIIPDSPSTPYDVRDVVAAVADDGEFLEIQAERAENVVCAFGRVEGRLGGVRGQPADPLRRLPGHRRRREGRPLRAHLRRLQHPGGHARRRARLPARRRPGAPGHPAPRREAALRLRRGHRPEDHGDHAQGLRRRLLRHGLQGPGRRPQPGLAHRADRGDGRGRRGRLHPPPHAQGRRGRGRGEPLA